MEIKLQGKLPKDHGLGRIRGQWLEDPRARRVIVCEVVNGYTGLDHTDPDDDETAKLLVVDAEVITEADDIRRARDMMDRARLERPGQQRLGDDNVREIR
jgi:hypothetical protein